MKQLSGWTIFSIRGVDINLHVSLLFLLFYVILVASSQFSYVVEASGLSLEKISGTPFWWSVIFAISLIASVLVHELGHVFVAQAKGAKVKRITLLMLGGVSEIQEISKSPSDELKIAIIGPVVSLGIGAVLLTLRQVTESPNLNLYCFWIGQLNIILGIFNLLPAYPMDGGRVLRAWMAKRHGYLEGTQRAIKVSRIFAWVFGILGVLQFNILLILIAFLVYFSGRSELFLMQGKAILKKSKVRDLMVKVPVLLPEANFEEAASAMFEVNSSILPVEGRMPGVFLAQSLSRIPREKWKTTFVGDHKAQVESPPQEDSDLADILSEEYFMTLGGLPVVEDGQVKGVIRLREVLERIQLGLLLGYEQPRRRIWLRRPYPTGHIIDSSR